MKTRLVPNHSGKVLVMACLAVIGTIGMLAAKGLFFRSPDMRSSSEAEMSAEAPAIPDTSPAPSLPGEFAENARVEPSLAVAVSSESNPDLAPDSGEASQVRAAGAREYVTGLINAVWQVNFDQRLSKEQATALAEQFKGLVGLGKEAVPGIREFLEKNQDLSFEGVVGAKWLGFRSVREGMMDALAEIGGPEAIALLAKTLQTTAESTEVALLARHLDQLAPGQYREEALRAARETMERVAKGDVGKQDVAPLFHLVQLYGDAGTVDDLARQYPQWSYYATMALANLPEGQGISALTKVAEDSDYARSSKRTVALKMLAQVAAQYPEAASTLVEQARANKIPSNAWLEIASGLAGDQYQFGSPVLDRNVPAELEDSRTIFQVHTNQNFYVHTPFGSIAGLRIYHVEDSNQNFYSVPVATVGSSEEISRRLNTVEQLLVANSTPQAVSALEEARLALKQRLPQ